MQQMREQQQPFFKPLSFSEQNINTNNRTYETSPCSLAPQMQVRPKLQQNSAQFQTSKARENEQNQVISQQQEQTQGNERISSLHVKLQHEADRIRKWKVQTEIEIKQKDKKIKESTHTIESLRKSILELQLQNESLSLRLQEEITSREEILHRINATRDMCNLLKDHSADTEERLQKCETERTELKYIEKQHVKQFEELSEKFTSLDITSKKEKEDLTEKLTAELKKGEELQKELKNHKEEMKTTLNDLEKLCDEKDLEIRDVRAELCKNEDEIHKMNSVIDELQSEIGNLQSDLQQKQTCLTESEEKLKKIM
ncbi:synaptonemal complex protein 1-like, partial [Saccostrea cucullata]|uniref:synaptonemal complex protein 1-like n=1 Tax=Saccostrea cuccullata TaxID=36930 RepID=UPI002ED53AC3